MGAFESLARVTGRIAGAFRSKSAGGIRWYWPTQVGDQGPPGTWQRNLNPTTDPSTLLAFSAVYACVNKIGQDIGRLPVRIVEMRGDEQVELKNDPFARLMRQPNEYQSGVDFIHTLMASTLLQGNGVVWMRRNGRNEPVELHPWDWRQVEPRVGDDGAVFYRLGANKLAGIPSGFIAPARDIIHHRLPLSSAYPLHGVTPIYAAASSSALGLRIIQQSQSFFGNMSRPSGVLSTEQNLNPEMAVEIATKWQENYREGGTGKTAVLPAGLKWQALTMSAVDAQLIETLRYAIEDVARVFNVPVFLIGDTSKVTYRNSEQLGRAYLQFCLGYHVTALQERLNLAFDFGDRHKVIFDLDDMLRTELDTRFGAYAKGIAAGLISINEARALEGYGPKKGGDEPMVQMQNVPLSIAVENAKNPPKPPAALPAPAPAAEPTPEPAKSYDPDDDDEIDDDEARSIEARVAELMGVAA